MKVRFLKMNLMKVGKLSFKFALFFLIILTAISFFDLKKVQAEEVPDREVVINELMWMGSSSHIADEWVELRNISDYDIDFSQTPYSLYSNDTLKVVINTGRIEAHSFFLINNRQKDFIFNNNKESVLNIDSDLVRNSSSSFLLNSNVEYKLYNKSDNTGELVDIADDGVGMPLAGDSVAFASMERNDIPGDGTQGVNWHTSIDSINFDFDAVEKGTPGFENSSLTIKLPIIPEYYSPKDFEQFTSSQEIVFSWAEEVGVDYECQISLDMSFTNLVDDSELNIGKYFWRVQAENQFGKVYTIPRSFEILEPVYSKAIVVNEIIPNPVGDDTAGEWIELYNSSSERVNLKSWIFQDSGSSLHTIQNDLYIESKSYLLVYRNISSLTLNNGGDKVKLYQPNNVLLSSTSYLDDGEEGWSWARSSTGKWSWTTKPTAGKVNIISLPKVDDPVQETEPVINTVPIEIPTGDFENYLDKLVKIRGKVISTSGNTFYLDDGSGVIKVYIQEKTGIEKPEMHRNDIFEIIGVVDLYGKTWRILPRVLSDILLIEKAPVITKATTAKKSVAKKVASKVVTAAKTPFISKAVAASATSPPDENTQKDKDNTLDQLIKTSIGLAVLFLVFLIIKILNQPKKKTSRQLGGHFGDDET